MIKPVAAALLLLSALPPTYAVVRVGKQNCYCAARPAVGGGVDSVATLNCCNGRDFGGTPDSTTGCALVDFPGPRGQCMGTGTENCISEHRFVACCAKQGSAGGVCWD